MKSEQTQPALYTPIPRHPDTPIRIYLSLALLGFVTALAQITFLRKGIENFSGNELGVSLGLFAWLAWVGAGGLFSRRFATLLRNPSRALYHALLVMAVLYPVTAAGLDLVRPVMGVPVGQVVGVGFIGLSYALLLAPFCFAGGADFAFGSAAAGPGGAARAFAAESSGAALGGVFFFVAGIRFFDGLGLAWTVSVGTAVAVLVLGWKDRTARSGSIAILTVLLVSVVWLGPPSDDLTLRKRFYPYFPLLEVQSPLGSLTWTRPLAIGREGQWARGGEGKSGEGEKGGEGVRGREGEKTQETSEYLFLDQSVLFYDGSPVMTDPDPRGAEQAVHPALMVHPDPERVLLVTTHVTGLLPQLLAHPVRTVDVAALDESLIRLEALNAAGTASALADPRVVIIPGDPRRALGLIPPGSYDVIIVNLPDPGTLLLNRFFTAEFFRLAAETLSPGGILSLAVGEPSNYIPPAMGSYLASLDGALSLSFRHRAWYPLDRFVALCSQVPTAALTGALADEAALVRRLPVRFMTSGILDADLSTERVEGVRKAVAGGRDSRVNADLTPSALLYRLVLWHGLTKDAGVTSLPRRGSAWVIFVVVLVVVVGCAFGAGAAGGAAAKGTALLFLGGIAGISAETVLMYLYQAGFGFLYSRIALLVAFFMAGMALGALGGPCRPERAAWSWTGYFLAVSVVVWAGPGELLPEWAGLALFLLLMTGAGALTGIGFAAGSSLLESAGVRNTGGAAYGIDLIGAALGTVVCGLVLPMAVGLYAPVRYCLLLSAAVAAGLSIGKDKN